MLTFWLVLAVFAAFFVAWNNGSNNAPNSIGTAVGAGVLSVKRALMLAAIASFVGAISLGIYVTDTVMRGIVNITGIPSLIVVKGMIAVLLATGAWTLISTFLEVPMSVHVCIIGGLIGFGLAIGASFISWSTVAKIMVAWVVAPIASAAMAYGLYHIFRRSFRDPSIARVSVITSSYITVSVPTLLTLIKTISISDIMFVLAVTLATSTIASIIVYLYWKKRVGAKGDPLHEVSRILLVMAAAAMAFSFGANDVANSAGPLAAVFYALGYGNLIASAWYAIIVAAIGLSAGIAMWGSKVIGTIGEKITPLSPPTAYVAQMAATLTMLVVSRLGLPVSTSMAIVGGVMGVGLSRGIRSVNKKLIARIFGLWLIALPATTTIAYILTRIFLTI